MDFNFREFLRHVNENPTIMFILVVWFLFYIVILTLCIFVG